jgi:[ribosomal protein S5]-alanine N-acetyltransferase
MITPEIETERLRLRRFRSDDLAALSLLFRDPEVVRYIGTGTLAAPDEIQTHLTSLRENYWREYCFGRWVMEDRISGDFIGYCGLRVNEGLPEIHYVLAREWWFAGLATEAASACLWYGFEKLSLKEIIALVRPENIASINVLKKLGMNFTGRQETFFDHTFHYYSVSATGWQPGDAAFTVRLLISDD